MQYLLNPNTFVKSIFLIAAFRYKYIYGCPPGVQVASTCKSLRVGFKKPPPRSICPNCFHDTFPHKRPPHPVMVYIRPKNEKVNDGGVKKHLLDFCQAAEPEEMSEPAREIIAHGESKVHF